MEGLRVFLDLFLSGGPNQIDCIRAGGNERKSKWGRVKGENMAGI